MSVFEENTLRVNRGQSIRIPVDWFEDDAETSPQDLTGFTTRVIGNDECPELASEIDEDPTLGRTWLIMPATAWAPGDGKPMPQTCTFQVEVALGDDVFTTPELKLYAS